MPSGLRRVHLGCFNSTVAGWHNTDITPHQYIARIPGIAALLYRLGWMTRQRYDQHRAGEFKDIHYLNVCRRFPFANDSIEAYFSSHMLEHLPLWDAEHVLREIHRTLAPNGFVRLVLPDLERALEEYDPEDPTRFLDTVFCPQKRTTDKNRHHWMYTAPYLARILREVGFQSVWIQKYQKTHYPPFVELDNRPENSFYVEAQK